MTVMMKCGHAANAQDETGKPVCVICIGIRDGADEVVEAPDLTGRTAFCVYGKHAEVPSDLSLPFFEHLPDQPRDRYYCGCFGWN